MEVPKVLLWTIQHSVIFVQMKYSGGIVEWPGQRGAVADARG
jgi:hypothetical protein